MKKHKEILLSIHDFNNIAKLMNNGFSLKNSMKLLNNKSNETIFKFIDNRLKNGEDICDVLLDYTPRRYKNNLENFIRFLPILNSINLVISLYESLDKLKKEYIKKLLYPCLMFITLIIGLYLFLIFCFPILISLMKSFDYNISIIYIFYKISMFILNILLIFILIILFTLIVSVQKNKQVYAYKIISKLKIFRFIKLIISNEFSIFYYECSKYGLSTIQSINVLKNFSNKPIINFIAKYIDSSLLKGKEFNVVFKSRFIDNSFYNFLQIALNINDSESLLKGYLEINKIKIDTFLKRLNYLIQLFTYLSISIILIFIYQILLLPLSIISNI